MTLGKKFLPISILLFLIPTIILGPSRVVHGAVGGLSAYCSVEGSPVLFTVDRGGSVGLVFDFGNDAGGPAVFVAHSNNNVFFPNENITSSRVPPGFWTHQDIAL